MYYVLKTPAEKQAALEGAMDAWVSGVANHLKEKNAGLSATMSSTNLSPTAAMAAVDMMVYSEREEQCFFYRRQVIKEKIHENLS